VSCPSVPPQNSGPPLAPAIIRTSNPEGRCSLAPTPHVGAWMISAWRMDPEASERPTRTNEVSERQRQDDVGVCMRSVVVWVGSSEWDCVRVGW
jgi:hypothetical protein